MSDLFKDIQSFDELDREARSDRRPEDLEDRELAEHLAVIRMLEQDAERQRAHVMPSNVEFRKQVVAGVAKPKRRSWAPAIFTVAAALVIGLLLSTQLPQGEAPATPVMIDEQFLANAIRQETRNAMAQHLERAELLLVSIRDFEMSCGDDQMSIEAEQELARELLLDQKRFAPQLTDPEFFQARRLFNELESVLVGVNTMDLCTDTIEVDLLNEHIKGKALLSRVRLVAGDIQA